MVSPVLPPDVPIVGPSKVQPQWWRWFRDANDAIAANEAGIIGLEADVADARATKLADVVLAPGNNVVAHGFGSTPSTWWAGRPRGAFPTLNGLYPSITPPRASASQVNSVSSTATHTLQFTPDVGAKLVAVASFENSSLTGMSFLQAGVTWSKIAGPLNSGAGDLSEMWVGTVGSAPSTSVAVTYTGGSTGAVASLTVAEIPEITSATPTASDAYAFPIVSFPGVRPYDTSQQCSTPPVPNAGDIVVTAVLSSSTFSPLATGWDCIAANFTFGTAYDDIVMFARVAQEAEHQPFRAIGHTFSDDIVVYQACFPTSLSPSGGAIPHGLREVSIDETNITIESIGNVTVDLFFK